LRAGDILLSASGESLEVSRDDKPGPVRRLQAVMRELSPGDRVEIVYQRDGQRSKTTVEATRAGMPDWGALPGMVPDLSWLEGLRDLPGTMPHHGLQLAALDADLSAYFGTAEGVLVLRATAENPLQLQSGDVLQSVNGRTVTDPRQAWEALQAARGDTVLELQVIRRGQSLTVQGEVPRRQGRRGP
jgi:S1-C subfamily serine protease